jgi:phosphate/sulfate permease
MGTSFDKIKKEHLRKAIILAVVIGIFCGLFAAGLILLILKVSQINIGWYYYLLIGVVVAAICCGALYLLLKPNDKKLAKKLDEQYNLDERVQTMVEYGDKEGDIVLLQREDTAKILSEVPRKKPSVISILNIAVVPVLACAIFFTAVFIPAKGEEGGSYVPPTQQTPTDKFTFTAWQKTALTQLTSDVQGSDLAENVNSGIVAILQTLYTTLETTETNALMNAALTSSASLIGGIIESVNTYSTISEELLKYENLTDLATGLTKCVNVYKSSTKFNSMSLVNARAEELDTLIVLSLNESNKPIYSNIGTLNTLQMRDEYAPNQAKSLNAALASLTEIDEKYSTDDICAAYKNLATKMAQFTTDGYANAQGLRQYLIDSYEAYIDEVSVAAYKQSYNSLMEKFIRQVLTDIFGVDVTIKDEEDEDNGEEDNSGNNSNGGGYGSGDAHYGNDDMEIYYPDENDWVKYGTVLDEFNGKVLELVEQNAPSDELQRCISEFFNILYNGLGTESNS